MANSDRPSGFRAVKSLTDAPVSMRVRHAIVADVTADSTNSFGNLFVGSPITLASNRASTALSNEAVAGVPVGFGRIRANLADEKGMFDPSNLERRYVDYSDTASGVWVVYYTPAELMIYAGQTGADLDLDLSSQADFGITGTALATDTAHGNTTTQNSILELVSGTDDFVVVEYPEIIGNDETLTNAIAWVRFQDTKHLAADAG